MRCSVVEMPVIEGVSRVRVLEGTLRRRVGEPQNVAIRLPAHSF